MQLFDNDRHSESLHCRYCNKYQSTVLISGLCIYLKSRCITRLDHHCFYVNNCIGANNYKLYLTTMLFTFLWSGGIVVGVLNEIIVNGLALAFGSEKETNL